LFTGREGQSERLLDGSSVSREAPALFCERPGVKFLWPTHHEVFNTPKNQGYNIDHSYGHGKQNLSFNFFILHLITFFFHEIFELTDELYQACRVKRGSKMSLFEGLRNFIRLIVFRSWEELLQTILCPSDEPWNRPQVDPQPA
jgi:hypothetical protein